MKSNINQYDFFGKVYMFFCLIRTRIFFSNARIIRFPFDIRNKKFIELGRGFTAGRNCRLEVCIDDFSHKKKCLIIGNNVQINDFVHIAAYKDVYIGNNVLIASKVFITDINHGNYNEHLQYDSSFPPARQPLSSAKVRIEDYVWIGESVCILSGATIGEHAIIGAGSVVKKSIPPYSIAVGNPAKVIKKLNMTTKCWERI